MKKTLATIAALAAITAAAGYITINSTITTNGVVEARVAAPSGAARLVELRLQNTQPTNGTVTVYAAHAFADGTSATNSVATISAEPGIQTVTNATLVLPGDVVNIVFSTATNGCLTAVLED